MSYHKTYNVINQIQISKLTGGIKKEIFLHLLNGLKKATSHFLFLERWRYACKRKIYRKLDGTRILAARCMPIDDIRVATSLSPPI